MTAHELWEERVLLLPAKARKAKAVCRPVLSVGQESLQKQEGQKSMEEGMAERV